MTIDYPTELKTLFESGNLNHLELIHAKSLAGTNRGHLDIILNKMQLKSISYREAFLEWNTESNTKIK